MPTGKVWTSRLLFVVCVCVCVCVFVRIRISPPRIKLSASNFAWRFIGVQGKESQILVNFASQKPKSGRISQRAGHAHPHAHRDVNITVAIYRAASGRRIGMCDIRQSPSLTKVLVVIQFWLPISCSSLS